MMDRLESMSVLLKVVESGSLSAASRKLGMPLASVSRKISELETYLKIRLLNRSTRRLELTDAGRSYLTASKRILEELGEAERAATGEYSAPKGDLVITAPTVFGRLYLLPVVTEFLKAYPDIDVRLMLTDRVVNLMEEHIDLAVRIGALADSSLLAARVGFIRQVVCGSPVYFAERGIPKSPKELSKHDCISIDGLMSSSQWSFPKGKTKLSVNIHSRLITSTVDSAIEAAVAGVGLARVFSYQIAAFQKTGALTVVLKDFEPKPWPVSLLYSGGHILPLKLRAFLDFVSPRLKAALIENIG
jgi:DNA-binding transcriptional LysR family regulator